MRAGWMPSKKTLFSLVVLGCVIAALAAGEANRAPQRAEAAPAAAPGSESTAARASTARESAAARESASSTTGVSVERGKYLVTVVGCGDCHTPFKMGPNGPEPDMSRMLSGHPQSVKLVRPDVDPAADWVWAGNATNTAFAGPWGITYAANLTPDTMSGIGIWTEEIFVNALRRGKHWGEARPIMPPMPWQALSNMTDDDLKSMYAYLRTIPPVSNTVPDYQPPARPTRPESQPQPVRSAEPKDPK